MSTGWSSTCPIALSLPAQKWWANWQNLVFFAIAPVAAPDSSATACGTCLSVMPPSSLADKRLVVLVSARALSGQIRGVGADPAQYLEEANAAGGALFTQRAGSASFNDRVLYQ
jgi:hypothetical protein